MKNNKGSIQKSDTHNIGIAEITLMLHEKYPYLKIVEIPLVNMVFEERVKHKCFHCKNYGNKWTCPPHLPNVDYPKMFKEYDHAAVIIYEVFCNDDNFEDKRAQSTNIIHRALLYLEKRMYEKNNSMALSFIGGSCKLCKNGCNKERCANPYISRVPWEATGCNVIDSLASIGIDVVFPISTSLHRYGLFLW